MTHEISTEVLMRSSHGLGRRLTRTVVGVAVTTLAVVSGVGIALASPASATPPAPTTAWKHGAFKIDPRGVVRESDIVLGSANTSSQQEMPLGNGLLGVAEWGANGFTAQLNRNDAMPARKSPGQVNIPGLATLTNASDFSGRLDLTDGVLEESGGGMALNAWVPANKDELIVDVTGADPSTTQTATINLWSGRNPTATTSGGIGSLSETFVDNAGVAPFISGQTFGTLAAITVGGQDVATAVSSSTSVRVSFKPNADGSFRVIVAAPTWNGTQGDPNSYAAGVIGDDATASRSALLSPQGRWWNNYWAHSGLIQMASADGKAQYLENLRTIYLYLEAASMRGTYSGSHAGIADLFNADQDHQDWDPAAYWLWNLRAEISANMSSGNFDLNLPIFNMYLNAIPNLQAWTQAEMGGLPGICLPETMRYNGNGLYNNGFYDASCDKAQNPLWNALDISSGPELSLYIWQQFQYTGDLSFLRKYYPIMKQSVVFLLAYQTLGSDGYLHAVANAHESQWGVPDPTTDFTADQTLFPEVVAASHLLGTDTGDDATLISQLRTAETEVPPYARTDAATKQQLLNPDETVAETQAADATGADVIADSYDPSAPIRNSENIGLEPVWPWGLVGDNSSLTALEDRTYTSRPNVNTNDWTMDAIDAARLGLANEVQSDLVSEVTKWQRLPDGMATGCCSTGRYTQPYIEEVASTSAALDEAFVQDYDGLLRIAPAWPSGWDGSGSIYIHDGSKVDVQVEGGTPVTVAIEAGTTETLNARNPWPGQAAEVVDGSTGDTVVASATSDTLAVPVQAGKSYLVEEVSNPTTGLPFDHVTGTPATKAKTMGSATIGIPSTATVGTVLGSTNYSYGVTEVDSNGDGVTTPVTEAGYSGRQATGQSPNDLYLNVSDSVAYEGTYSTAGLRDL